jgi:pyridoxal phosphate enzyme (YggS family)
MPEAIWHLIGHLQSNKVRPAVDTFDLVQSVDSLRLAQRLDRAAADRDKNLQVLIEVNVAREPSKTGIDPEGLKAALVGMSALEHLSITGLMTIAPFVEDPEDIRWVFRNLRQLRDDLGDRLALDRLRELSMGMSDDYRVAIEEGATMVRLGRAIFGERTPNPG